jgi:hypothetical protein
MCPPEYPFMTQIRVLVVARDVVLRQSLEFALGAEGYAVDVHADISAVPGASGYACLVLDETGLAGRRDDIAAFCAGFATVVALADRPDGFVARLAHSVVAKPLDGSAVTAAVRSALNRTVLNT